MLTVLSVIGTRPEAIKMAPVIKELERHRDHVRSFVCSTGQHQEMLNQVLDLFQITPDYDLHLMQVNQGLAQLTARLFTSLDDVLEDVKPNYVLAQGDTTTVLVASLVAFYRGIKFGHVEAGLRTGDKHKPFPEEINRRLADVVADLFFAPTERARQTLLCEGVSAQDIYLTGNTVIDALLDIASRNYEWSNSPLACLPRDRRLVLITAHRRESFGEQFKELCLAIRDLAEAFQKDGVHFVYPVHLNPNVRKPVGEILSNIPNVSLIEPLDYLALVQLMKHATLILTDSGGIQEEAPSLRVPVLVMRDTTERPEGIEAGVSRLVGTQRARIVQEAQHLLCDPAAHAAMATNTNPYGDGKAAMRIVAALFERVL
ncbi:MAG TPA: UDP-N-acetylglucosamine 2-epimerase (non-hydrolyzing) [Ktedonobacterales bacterium]|jgi:UDP-N-acetylglucosamine 2-epimerase